MPHPSFHTFLYLPSPPLLWLFPAFCLPCMPAAAAAVLPCPSQPSLAVPFHPSLSLLGGWGGRKIVPALLSFCLVSVGRKEQWWRWGSISFCGSVPDDMLVCVTVGEDRLGLFLAFLGWGVFPMLTVGPDTQALPPTSFLHTSLCALFLPMSPAYALTICPAHHVSAAV